MTLGRAAASFWHLVSERGFRIVLERGSDVGFWGVVSGKWSLGSGFWGLWTFKYSLTQHSHKPKQKRP